MTQNNRSALAEGRRQELVRILRREGEVSTSEMAERFGVSEMTVRRYLHDLEEDGLAIRQYGGAVAARRVTFEFAFDERHRHNLEAKQRIGAEAAGRVEKDQTLFMDTGTTTLEVARALVRRNLTCRVVTSSLMIASALWGRPDIELMLLGGRVREGSPDLVGAGTEMMLERLSADVAFLGSDGLDPERGRLADVMSAARPAERMGHNTRRGIIVAAWT